jgi:hypothetical protein
MKDLMANGDGIFKLARQTSKCLVELNDDSITPELGMPYAYLNVAIGCMHIVMTKHGCMNNLNLLSHYQLNMSTYYRPPCQIIKPTFEC